MFKAQNGYVLISSDYSAQEPRLTAQMCQDPAMIKAYRDGKDLYAEIASIAFNVPYEECLEFRPDGTTNKEGKARRTSAKSILLGITYGRGIKSVAEQLNCTPEKAQSIQDKVFKGFPKLEIFEKECQQKARENGYVSTFWGRKRRLPDMQLPEYEFTYTDKKLSQSSDLLDFDDDVEISNEVPYDIQDKYIRQLHRAYFSQKKDIIRKALENGIKIKDNGGFIAQATRQCVNSVIQGSAADLSKLAMINVGNDKTLKELGFKLLIPVHDELIGECPIENVKECEKRFSQLMVDAAKDMCIPIKCDISCTKSWYGDEIII